MMIHDGRTMRNAIVRILERLDTGQYHNTGRTRGTPFQRFSQDVRMVVTAYDWNTTRRLRLPKPVDYPERTVS